MATYPAIELVQCLGAGVDHILAGDVPERVSLARTVDGSQPGSMSSYVLLHVLRYHRDFAKLQEQHARREWTYELGRPAGETTVGSWAPDVLGASGREASTGRFRRPCLEPNSEGIARHPLFHRSVELRPFLAGTHQLVCLLPLTGETRDILAADLFASLPAGAFLINAGRGQHLVEADLTSALDAGRLAAATLDVMRQEPVPSDHPFWGDRRILITPHTASTVDRRAVIPQIVENLDRVRLGQTPRHLVDRSLGY